MATSKVARYILLPARGLKATSAPEGMNFLLSLQPKVGGTAAGTFAIGGKKTPRMRVLDSIHENGAKLIEASPEDIPAMRSAAPGIRIVPEVFYFPAVLSYPAIEQKVKLAAVGIAAAKIQISVVLRSTGAPVKGATVVAFTDFEQKQGAQAVTNAQGTAQLALGAASKRLDRLYVLPVSGSWPFMKKNITIASGTQVKVEPITFPFVDSVRHFYDTPGLAVGAGVTIGVVDSGAGPHPDLVVAGGLNTVTGENPTDFGNNGGEGHGTHVSGIIAARGEAPTGMRGIAPGVQLRSYRVFGQNAKGASNFSIAKAIDAAVAEGCDLINMSLGGGPDDPLTNEAISDARAAGVVVLAANGNDDRQPVSFPAAFDLCLAVSAMGRKGTFPTDSVSQDSVARPTGTDKLNFVASFSNVGEDTDLTGPGVGVISTVPSGYAVMDGTSMACPAATGALARQLSKNPQILNMTRDQARSNAIIELFTQVVKPLGFGPLFEGKGQIKA
jgi:subtilisin family serine protease